MPIDTKERAWNLRLAAELRANDGRVLTGPLAGSDLLLLTTIGAKSGEPRISPLGYSRDRERYVVVGSNSGRDWSPAWVTNVMANPEVSVEVGATTFRARAAIESGAERRRLLDNHIAKIPIFERYETMTDRPLPVVTLTLDEASAAEPDAGSWEESLIADLRANGGRPSEGPLAGHPLLLMTSTGAWSGLARRAILTYSRDGDAYVVAGTKGGAPTDPAWVANVRAHPVVRLEVDNESFAATADVVVEAPERDRLWQQHVHELPWFAPYAEQAGRVIPMVRLTRKVG
ncbi:MAG: nitroreductase family deazaflavin-dependent oxidoreductase [Chloroflexi bacterium]|nr:nitroreductase family deazaflavin-dependent oxidoreductase [Chloroflexota bacterium]